MMEPKNYTWKTIIYKDIVKACETGLVPDVNIPKTSTRKFVAPVSKEELIAGHYSRMGKKLNI